MINLDIIHITYFIIEIIIEPNRIRTKTKRKRQITEGLWAGVVPDSPAVGHWEETEGVKPDNDRGGIHKIEEAVEWSEGVTW